MASAASMAPTSPFVSIMPKEFVSIVFHPFKLSGDMSPPVFAYRSTGDAAISATASAKAPQAASQALCVPESNPPPKFVSLGGA